MLGSTCAQCCGGSWYCYTTCAQRLRSIVTEGMTCGQIRPMSITFTASTTGELTRDAYGCAGEAYIIETCSDYNDPFHYREVRVGNPPRSLEVVKRAVSVPSWTKTVSLTLADVTFGGYSFNYVSQRLEWSRVVWSKKQSAGCGLSCLDYDVAVELRCDGDQIKLNANMSFRSPNPAAVKFTALQQGVTVPVKEMWSGIPSGTSTLSLTVPEDYVIYYVANAAVTGNVNPYTLQPTSGALSITESSNYRIEPTILSDEAACASCSGWSPSGRIGFFQWSSSDVEFQACNPPATRTVEANNGFNGVCRTSDWSGSMPQTTTFSASWA